MLAETRLGTDGVLTLRLLRPEQRNALNLEMLREANAGLGSALRGGSVRAVAVFGSGGYFSAGADLKEMAEARERGDEGRRQLRAAMAELISLMTELRTLPWPTVAFVEGGASGGGVGLLGSCQWVVAEEQASFRLPEASLGLFPYIISPILIRRMGLAAFLKLTFEGRKIQGAEAREIGLVDETVAKLPDASAALSKPARPATVWPSGADARLDVEAALGPWASVSEDLRRAARTSALLASSMSLPIAMRTAALELGSLVERLGGSR